MTTPVPPPTAVLVVVVLNSEVAGRHRARASRRLTLLQDLVAMFIVLF